MVLRPLTPSENCPLSSLDPLNDSQKERTLHCLDQLSDTAMHIRTITTQVSDVTDESVRFAASRQTAKFKTGYVTITTPI